MLNLVKVFVAGLAAAGIVVPAQAQISFAPLAERLIPSVVNISTELQEEKDSPEVMNNLLFSSTTERAALGSGFIVSEDGYIATNKHVIDKADKISAITADGTIYEAELIGADDKTDVAVIKIKPDGKLQPVEFGDSDKIRVGDWILAIGNPFGLGSSVTAGIISAKSRDIADGPYDDYLQTDASINQGNSGGPMFDTTGKVVGINTVIFSQTGNNSGVGFALPSGQAEWVIDKLKTTGKVERRWLGLEIKPTVMADNQKALSISAIKDTELAAANKLQAGDVILSYDEIKADSAKDFAMYISKLPADKVINLVIWRGGDKLEVKAETALLPEETSRPGTAEKQQPLNGEYYAALGLRLDGLKIVSVDAQSEAALKGVKAGDVLQKVNETPIYLHEELVRQIDDAALSRELLRLDFESVSGESYFVEISVKPLNK